MGTGSSKPDRVILELPDDERYFGLENFGNTCYCNSVVQTLYFCKPFRDKVIKYAAKLQSAKHSQSVKENILTSLAELFVQINNQKKKTGYIAPRKFVQRVKTDNELFSSFMHQDAHEFFNWLLNEVSEILEKEERERPSSRLGSRLGSRAGSRSSSPTKAGHSPTAWASGGTDSVLATGRHGGTGALNGGLGAGGAGPSSLSPGSAHPDVQGGLGSGRAPGSLPPHSGPPSSGGSASGRSGGKGGAHVRSPSLQELSQVAAAEAAKGGGRGPVRTWVHELFQGRLVNETRCLQCEAVTSREEDFYDLSLEIDQNSSLTQCLQNFSSMETLNAEDKFFCDSCGCLQEAQKRMRLKQLPPVLCLHLKRFKYQEQLGRMKKLMYRVVFPFELKLCNATDDCPDVDASYHLIGVVVHMGAHPNHGHYVAIVKSHGQWICFDDDQVLPVTEAQVQSVFGSTQESTYSRDGEPQGPTHVDHGYILLYQRGDPAADTWQRQPNGGQLH